MLEGLLWAAARRTGERACPHDLGLLLTVYRFYKQLINSSKRGALWRLIGSQIVFARVNVTTWFGSETNPYNSDAWDGYMSNKNRTLKTLYDNKIDNTIFMAGDSHAK
jgi:alkaline phosphatase D